MVESSGASPGSRKGYSIRVAGHLAPEWSEWFGGLSIRCHPDGTTTIEGAISDQPALHGVLLKVRDLGLALVAVNPIELNQDVPFSTRHTVSNGKEEAITDQEE